MVLQNLHRTYIGRILQLYTSTCNWIECSALSWMMKDFEVYQSLFLWYQWNSYIFICYYASEIGPPHTVDIHPCPYPEMIVIRSTAVLIISLIESHMLLTHKLVLYIIISVVLVSFVILLYMFKTVFWKHTSFHTSQKGTKTIPRR